MAYIDPKYKNRPQRKKSSPRKPWRAFYYANGHRTYLGNYSTRAEALAVEYREKLRRQNELLNDYPEEIQHIRQQSLFS